MTATPPREGTCRRCNQTRPLFQFFVKDELFEEPLDAWLCARDWSIAATIHEAGGRVRDCLPTRPASFDPWLPPPTSYSAEQPEVLTRGWVADGDWDAALADLVEGTDAR